MTPSRISWITWLALGAWFSCFGVLARYGTWLPFGVVGALLALATIQLRVVRAASLRLSLKHIGLGLVSGLVMVVLTHAGYGLLAVVLPSVLPATGTLFGLLDAVGLSNGARATLIVVIASCEEVLFRGPLLAVPARELTRAWPLAPGAFARVASFAVAYALTTAPLRSPLLVLCALVCGCIWGMLTLLSRALTVPILAHAIWDLGVLLIWPLVARR